MKAVRHVITEVWELAEPFDVSCEFMRRARMYPMVCCIAVCVKNTTIFRLTL